MYLGVIEGLPAEEYHRISALSSSGLKALEKSPLHFWAQFLDPEREPRIPTAQMELGTAIHSLVLEPESFLNQYVIQPNDAPKYPSVAQFEAKKPSQPTIDAIAWWKAFEDANAGKIVLTLSQARRIQAVAKRVKKSDAAAALFESGKAELSYFWNDPETGVYCKARADWVSDEGFLVDLKSTVDASPDGFRRSIANYGYDIQAAWYSWGAKAASGFSPSAFIFAAFETESPFACGYYSPTPRVIAQAETRIIRLKQLYAECLAAGEWPGYPEQILSIDLPPWATKGEAKSLGTSSEPEVY